MSVCLCLLAYFRNRTSKLHAIFTHVNYGRTICTSTFVDDAMCSHIGPNTAEVHNLLHCRQKTELIATGNKYRKFGEIWTHGF